VHRKAAASASSTPAAMPAASRRCRPGERNARKRQQ
jgi:hypothetical protein